MNGMNRAVAIAAVCSVLVLIACGLWLALNPPPHARSAAIGCQNKPITAGNVATVHTNSSANPQPPSNQGPQEGPSPTTEKQPLPVPSHRTTLPPNTPTRETEARRLVTITVSGRVQAPNSSPVAGADIWLETVAQRKQKGQPDADSRALCPAAKADNDGAFAFTIEHELFESAALTLYVSARARGYGPSVPEAIFVGSGGTFAATLTLRDAGAAAGRVVNEQGTGVSGVKVALGKQAHLTERPAHAGSYFEAFTNADGYYEFSDVPRGSYSIGVLSTIHNTRQGPREAVIGETAVKVADIVIKVVTSIRFRCVDAEGGSIHARCSLEFNADGKVKRMTAFASGDGRVELPYPPVGEYDLVLQLEGYLPAAPLRLKIEFGKTTDVGEISVRKDPAFVKEH